MLATIRGRAWVIKFPNRPIYNAEGEECDGLCDPPTDKNPAIRLHRSLKGIELLRVAIHESLHAANWDLSEEAVDETSTDIGNLLWALGYRRVDL